MMDVGNFGKRDVSNAGERREWPGDANVEIDMKDMAGIETVAGLREAIIDVISDETEGTFTMRWLKRRLPYGRRVEYRVNQLIMEGKLERRAGTYHWK